MFQFAQRQRRDERGADPSDFGTDECASLTRSDEMCRRMYCKKLEEVCQQQKFLDTRREVDELQLAVAAMDRGDLQGDDRSEAATVEELEIGEVEGDAAASFDQRTYERSHLRSVLADDLAVAEDRGHGPAFLVGRLLDFIVEGLEWHAVFPLLENIGNSNGRAGEVKENPGSTGMRTGKAFP
jgi:hypothetical protein